MANTKEKRLLKGMFGTEFRNASNLFGLHCGQMNDGRIVHNGGWYNPEGEKLGWGDLSIQDVQNLNAGLEDGEFFIILSERASFWNFVTNPGILGSLSKASPDVESPGQEYIIENAIYIIGGGEGQLYRLTDRLQEGEARDWTHQDVTFSLITREEVKLMLQTGQPAPTVNPVD